MKLRQFRKAGKYGVFFLSYLEGLVYGVIVLLVIIMKHLKNLN
jgi:hypothetical protein